MTSAELKSGPAVSRNVCGSSQSDGRGRATERLLPPPLLRRFLSDTIVRTTGATTPDAARGALVADSKLVQCRSS